MWRFVPNCPDDHSRFRLVYIIENSVRSDAQLPNRIEMVPGRNETHNDFPIAGLPGRFLSQLYFNSIQDLGPLVCPQASKIIRDIR